MYKTECVLQPAAGGYWHDDDHENFEQSDTQRAVAAGAHTGCEGGRRVLLCSSFNGRRMQTKLPEQTACTRERRIFLNLERCIKGGLQNLSSMRTRENDTEAESICQSGCAGSEVSS